MKSKPGLGKPVVKDSRKLPDKNRKNALCLSCTVMVLFLCHICLAKPCAGTPGYRPMHLPVDSPIKVSHGLDSTAKQAGDSMAMAKTADSTASASNDSTGAHKPVRERYIDVSVEYGSNFTYRHQIGATPMDAPYLYPSVLYHDKTGLWASFAAYRLLKPYSEVQNDGSVTTLAPTWIEEDMNVGWDFKPGKDNDASLSYMFSKFDRDILLVKEAPENTLEAYFGHDFKLIYIGLRGDYTYENFTGILNNERVNVPVDDYYGTAEFSREWYIDGVFTSDDYFDIFPMFSVLAGTDNFIGKFIVARYPTSQLAAHYAHIASQFLVQEFILDVPVGYNIGNFTLTPTFEYTILTQKLTETAPTAYPIYRFSVAYRFNFK